MAKVGRIAAAHYYGPDHRDSRSAPLSRRHHLRNQQNKQKETRRFDAGTKVNFVHLYKICELKLWESPIYLIYEFRFHHINESLMFKSLSYLIRTDMLLKEQAIDDFQQIRESLEEHGLGLDDLTEGIVRVTPSCEEMLVDCIWKSDLVPCNLLFSSRLTDEGLCCSFRAERNDHYLHTDQRYFKIFQIVM